MWPWGHAAVGYLLLSLWWRLDYDAPPVGAAVLALGFGTQLPDLIDKPLAWTWTVLPNGRSLAHSALTATLLCVVLWVVVRESGRRRIAGAFLLGYWAHILSDGLGAIVGWQLGELAYLGYPVLSPPTYETGKSFAAHLGALEMTPLFGLELVLIALALVVWVRDGYPGLATLGDWVGVVDRDVA